MARFTVVYFGTPSFGSEAEGKAYMASWRSWADSAGEALVEEANPVMPTRVLDASGVRDGDEKTRFSGSSVIEAQDLDAAVTIMRGCPHLEFGSIELGEQMRM